MGIMGQTPSEVARSPTSAAERSNGALEGPHGGAADPTDPVPEASIRNGSVTDGERGAIVSAAISLHRAPNLIHHLVGRDAVADQASDPGRDIEHPAVLHSLVHGLTCPPARHLHEFGEHHQRYWRPGAIAGQRPERLRRDSALNGIGASNDEGKSPRTRPARYGPGQGDEKSRKRGLSHVLHRMSPWLSVPSAAHSM